MAVINIIAFICNEDRDQMLHSAASDPGLHCLSMYYILTSL